MVLEVIPNVGGMNALVVPRVVVAKKLLLWVTCQPKPQLSVPPGVLAKETTGATSTASAANTIFFILTP
jgi:hypothetical protein